MRVQKRFYWVIFLSVFMISGCASKPQNWYLFGLTADTVSVGAGVIDWSLTYTRDANSIMIESADDGKRELAMIKKITVPPDVYWVYVKRLGVEKQERGVEAVSEDLKDHAIPINVRRGMRYVLKRIGSGKYEVISMEESKVIDL